MSKVLFAQSGQAQSHFVGTLPAESIKMATVIVTIGPIIFVYPYIQKYFVKGITIGAVKG
jgi:putative aldouronate transport system permease protein